MRPPPKPGLLARRQARMAMAAARPRGADPDLRRAAVRLRGPDRGLQPSGDPRARGGRRRRGSIGDLARCSWSRWRPRPVSSIVERAGDLASAARAIRSGEAIAAVYIPANFERDLKAERRPQVVAFYNQQFLTAAGIASSGLSDSLAAAAQRGVRGPRGADSGPHRSARRRDDRAGQSGEELRAVPAARAAADGRCMWSSRSPPATRSAPSSAGAACAPGSPARAAIRSSRSPASLRPCSRSSSSSCCRVPLILEGLLGISFKGDVPMMVAAGCC